MHPSWFTSSDILPQSNMFQTSLSATLKAKATNCGCHPAIFPGKTCFQIKRQLTNSDPKTHMLLGLELGHVCIQKSKQRKSQPYHKMHLETKHANHNETSVTTIGSSLSCTHDLLPKLPSVTCSRAPNNVVHACKPLAIPYPKLLKEVWDERLRARCEPQLFRNRQPIPTSEISST